MSQVSRRTALVLGAGAIIAPKHALAAPEQPVLVELFTSQGCSSCPPADKFAAELDKDPNLVVLSYNVDYWDYLGWRDTLAKPEYSQRQYDYARQRGDGSVYTPQMVVQGQSHAVGSNQRDVLANIKHATNNPAPIVLDVAVSKSEITVSVAAVEATKGATLWLMAVEPRVTQEIERGENTGKQIEYVNVVRNLVPAAMLNGEAYSGRWMRESVMRSCCKNVVAVLQQGKVGPVLAVARV